MAWKDKVRVEFSCRRARIDPGRKREEYISRMEEVMRVCDRIAGDPAAFDVLQVRALDCMIRAVRACYGMVSDVELNMIEDEIEELKQREKELGFIGYRFDDDPE